MICLARRKAIIRLIKMYFVIYCLCIYIYTCKIDSFFGKIYLLYRYVITKNRKRREEGIDKLHLFNYN